MNPNQRAFHLQRCFVSHTQRCFHFRRCFVNSNQRAFHLQRCFVAFLISITEFVIYGSTSYWSLCIGTNERYNVAVECATITPDSEDD